MDRSEVTLERMRTFVRVAERGSFSAVARELSVGQATISRHVAELEQALGIVLINRTTRTLSLTPEGTRYHQDARDILNRVEEAMDGLHRAGDGLSGPIRISCTAALGVRHVARALFAFQDLHPAIAIDLNVSDVRIDLVHEAADVAIRLGRLEDSSMVRKFVGSSRRVLVASRGYLALHGSPESPDDLQHHRTIRMSNVADSGTLVLRRADQTVVSVPFGGRLLVDHGLAAREAIAHGRGIAPAHLWLIDDLIESGAVEVVLPDYTPEAVPLSMLIVPGRVRIQRVRVLVNELASFLRELPGVRVQTDRNG